MPRFKGCKKLKVKLNAVRLKSMSHRTLPILFLLTCLIAASLTEYFKKYGTVVDAVVKMEIPVDAYGSGGSSGVPGKSRGFGFVKFADSAAVDEVSKV